MNTHPILFSAPMVRALLDGRKTMTRRVVKLSRHADCAFVEEPDGDLWTYLRKDGPGSDCINDYQVRCPWEPGDLLYARETCSYGNGIVHKSRVLYRADDEWLPTHARWRPSIHMHRWASRITLYLTDVRVERIQDISEADAKAEGCDPYMPGEGIIEPPTHPDEHQYRPDYRTGLSVLWDSINGEGAWARNDWVFALTFRPIPANVDAVLSNPERYGIPKQLEVQP